MAKYKVLPIAMLVRGNKMAKHGEIIDGVNLLSDADELVKAGFVEEVKVVKEEIESKPKK